MGRLDRKVGVVTKAASAIGRGTALCLAKEGAALGGALELPKRRTDSERNRRPADAPCFSVPTGSSGLEIKSR